MKPCPSIIGRRLRYRPIKCQLGGEAALLPPLTGVSTIKKQQTKPQCVYLANRNTFLSSTYKRGKDLHKGDNHYQTNLPKDEFRTSSHFLFQKHKSLSPRRRHPNLDTKDKRTRGKSIHPIMLAAARTPQLETSNAMCLLLRILIEDPSKKIAS
ncbi:hypothetical protein Tco_0047270 [Tanacetum coccineum]